MRSPTTEAAVTLLQLFSWCTNEKMSPGCRRGSADVALAFAGPASPPPLWTAAPLMPLIKDLRNMPAACPELIVPPSTSMSALLQHRRRAACGKRTRNRENNRFACFCEMILVYQPRNAASTVSPSGAEEDIKKKKKGGAKLHNKKNKLPKSHPTDMLTTQHRHNCARKQPRFFLVLTNEQEYIYIQISQR